MERILLHQQDSQWLSLVPEDCGVLSFYSADKLLYISNSVNMKGRIDHLWKKRNSDSIVKELFESSDNLDIKLTKTPLEALCKTKSLLSHQTPEYNSRITLWKDYVYLAVNPQEFPFIKITEYTEEEWFYLGPFRSRFFLMDLMELMNKLLKLPFCEVKEGPCEKLDNDRCQGWCISIYNELSQEENSEKPELLKLDALLKEAYIHADNGLLEMLDKEKAKYEDELQFEKGELLKPNIELLKKYKQWLIFLYQAKQLTYNTDLITVQNGQMIRCIVDEKEFTFPFQKIEYRKNEQLAHNKNMLEEAWILFKWFPTCVGKTIKRKD